MFIGYESSVSLRKLLQSFSCFIIAYNEIGKKILFKLYQYNPCLHIDSLSFPP